MNCINNLDNNQSNFLILPSPFINFINTETITTSKHNHDFISFNGHLKITDEDQTCPFCNKRMCLNKTYNTTLKHIPFGNSYSELSITIIQFICYDCNYTKSQDIPFKCSNHMITNVLKEYIISLLEKNNFTNTEISYITGVNRNIIKDIDKKRLINKYTIDGIGEELIKPESQAKFLGIDEFKLHKGHKYATHIIDLETGHILWIAKGKKKQVVYDFINHVGFDWMQNVVAVACDMNSDFEDGFKEKCPHLKIVFDYFHIIKNFN